MIKKYKIKSISFVIDCANDEWFAVDLINDELVNEYRDCVVLAHNVDEIPRIIRADCGWYVNQFEAEDVDSSYITKNTKILSRGE